KVIDVTKIPEVFEEGVKPERELLNQVKVGALTNLVPMGVSTIGGTGAFSMVVSDETMKEIIKNKQELSTYVYLNSSDPMATQEAIEEIKESTVYVYNVFQRRQQQEQMIILMSVFTYGFITLISLISIANIFNTISTSISLRKRE